MCGNDNDARADHQVLAQDEVKRSSFKQPTHERIQLDRPELQMAQREDHVDQVEREYRKRDERDGRRQRTAQYTRFHAEPGATAVPGRA
jgi:hypothetical protein